MEQSRCSTLLVIRYLASMSSSFNSAANKQRNLIIEHLWTW
jgi:hypothetical protein